MLLASQRRSVALNLLYRASGLYKWFEQVRGPASMQATLHAPLKQTSCLMF